MKRIFLIAACLMMLSSPAFAFDREWWQEFSHRTYIYESWGHFWFSLCGYWHPTLKDVQRSKDEHWWGQTILVEKEGQ